MSIEANLQEIRANIARACEKVNRNPEEITIIGVTKYVTIDRAKQLIDAGVHHLGENRTEELLNKYEAIEAQAKWHFIGTIQSRKVKDVIGKVAMIHSLERLSVAKQINSRSEEIVPCFVQVNVSGEASKHGVSPEQLPTFIEELNQFEKVQIVGLMTMAPHVDDETVIRDVFKKTALLRDEIMEKQLPHAPCTFLSMGMSNDYEIAIEEGATHIRLGSILVGE